MDKQGQITGTTATDEARLEYLSSQIEYITAHFQIADTKAAGLIAYISVLISFTVSKLDISTGACITPNQLLGLISLSFGGISIFLALLVILPRIWPGNIPDDNFSWQGIARRHDLKDSYTERIARLPLNDMEQSLADTIEHSSVAIRRKYRLVYFALIISLISSVGQAAYWLKLISDRCE